MGEYDESHVEKSMSLEERYKDLYIPAKASKGVIDYMADNPFCDGTILRAATNVQACADNYPEVVQLAGIVLDNRRQVERTYADLSSRTGTNQKNIATVLFEAAQNGKVHSPTGPLQMGYLDNPFALVITAGKDDFKHLDARDIGGFYGNEIQITTGPKKIKVPLVAILNSGTYYNGIILKHEMRHAYNAKVKESLVRAEKVDLWGDDVFLSVRDRLKTSSSVEKIWNQNSQNPDRKGLVRSSPGWRRMMRHSLNDIKDELVVRLITGESVVPVTTRFDVYDDLQRDFALKEASGLPTFYWETYTGVVNSEVGAARKAINAYESMGLKLKAETLPWMLMRVPLGSWNTELNSAGVTSEVEIIEKISKVRESRKSGSITAINLDDERLQKMKSSQDELLIPQLIDYWQMLTK